MSNAPYYINLKKDEELDKKKLQHSMMIDGLIDSYDHYHMGVTAENVAEKFQVTRDEQDKFALKSQEKALKAQQENKFKEEIAGGLIDHDDDEHPRAGLTLAKLNQMISILVIAIKIY